MSLCWKCREAWQKCFNVWGINVMGLFHCHHVELEEVPKFDIPEFKVEIDELLPVDVIEFRSKDKVVGKIINIGKSEEKPKQICWCEFQDNLKWFNKRYTCLFFCPQCGRKL